MKILVVGAGSIGGYFGGRLLEAGGDVTFLVRPRRAARLAETGLVLLSPLGNFERSNPPTVTADALAKPFDLILLSCKAYDLDDALSSLAPAVGPTTAILPLLNGLRHLEALEKRFGAAPVLGGQCTISTVLDPEGRILHLNTIHSLSFGERDGVRSARTEAIAATLSAARFDSSLSTAILQEMWEKWVFIAAGAGITCLMRATIGDIVAAGAADLARSLLDECAAIAARAGFPPRPSSLTRSRTTFTAPGSPFAASMFRDIERGTQIEADHIISDLLGRAAPGASPLLRVVSLHLLAYQARRAREAGAATAGAATAGAAAQPA